MFINLLINLIDFFVSIFVYIWNDFQSVIADKNKMMIFNFDC